MTPWLYVIGIGEEGIDTLSPAARALIATAEVLVGGERHLAKVPESGAERLTWSGGLSHAVEEISKRLGKRVAVLASGDPFDYGIGAVLVRHFEAKEMTVVPVPGAFSLACARMGWPRPDVETITLHGRPLESLNLFLAPGARLLILSRGGDTPGRVAALLEDRGFGESPMTVLEHMGGPDEKRIEGVAQSWDHPRCADLNTIAVECVAGANVICLSRVPGLPEEAFEHDGKITKREVRAATLARLMPLGGQVLWDVGAGSGSIAIEWMRA
ncbi:MAG: precorrin-6y C5,15-methyltransferase (decarboxylating) subunit CbiE, partial [Rhodospirillales bacterium]